MYFKQLLISMAILMLFGNIVRSDIINVPDDQETIQGGINAADDGDTVLVAPGEYVENINFSGMAISVIGNPDDPSEVVINGDENGSVIRIDQEEGEGSILNGFMIINGTGSEDLDGDNSGGGIHCSGSSPILTNLIITGNVARFGGGIFLQNSSPIIHHIEIFDNHATESGGGMLCSRLETEPHISYTIFHNNTSESYGGGVSTWKSRPTFDHVSIVNNVADEQGGGYVDNSSQEEHSFVTFRNTIFWGNEPNQLSIGPTQAWGDTIQVFFSDIEGGIEDVFIGNEERDILVWGENNINDDPVFVDVEAGDFSLTIESPCIDAGDPEGDLDPDGTRADMGAFSFYSVGALNGMVFDLQNEQPLEGAVVTTEHGFTTVTNEEGYWQLIPIFDLAFDLTISMVEYLDSTLIDIEMARDDTLSLIVSLRHAELEPSIEGIITEIEIGQSQQFEFSISNPGNGVLSWEAGTRYRGDAGREPWELRQSYEFGQILDDTRLYGVAYIDSFFYVSGAHDGNPTMYILNIEGELIDTFAQPGDDNRGIRDFTYDGELIWGVVRNTVYGMTLQGEVVDSFDAPYNPSTAITWDPDREILWICSTVSNPVGVDREGNQVDGMEIDRDGMRIYALSYFQDDSENAPLYIFSKEIESGRQTLHKHNFETNEKSFITFLEPEAGGSPQGAFITNKIDPYSWVFISVADDANNDRVDVWQLESNTSWSVIEPVAGTIDPGAEQDMSLIINTADLEMIDYPAELFFRHNGFWLETVIPIDLTVTPLVINDQNGVRLPTKFAITGAYPNPFNSTIRINYSVPETSQLSIKMYDITGSLVDEVVNEIYQSGQHSITWNASSLPSGIYFARMQVGEFTQTVKLMLMK